MEIYDILLTLLGLNILTTVPTAATGLTTAALGLGSIGVLLLAAAIVLISLQMRQERFLDSASGNALVRDEIA